MDLLAYPDTTSLLLPVEDTEFLLREEMRPIRFALEFAKADLALKDWGVRSTVIVFGSARIRSKEAAAQAQDNAKTEEERKAADNLTRHTDYYEVAREFAQIVSLRGGAFAPRHRWRENVIATGGGPGIMEAANRGAHDVGAPSIGFNITLLREQRPNAYITPELNFRFHYFAMRKMHLAMRASALAIFPGGFGTLDEMFELLTLQQTGKALSAPIVLFGSSYWKQVINFDALVDTGMIARADLELFEFVDTAEEGWASLVRRGLTSAASPRE
ncbi:LOG family protein [Novosphingobium sp. G106]|uniref:LOG family protein n=1 Tax=Novosphingobium sp. G106 TaxID=2849500 RepID=UPI001C2D0517|nr:LOG family protein [Novosphingobium sp. G106]MBV1691915.1 LOG family protein [Novosphingobium sp. G106]